MAVYWCEITDRSDVGADLKCPQANEAGKPYWSYGLILDVSPGDIVFHYSTTEKGFVGASVAGGPCEERPIVWVPHGTVGRSKRDDREARPGWWRPLYGFVRSNHLLTMQHLNEPENERWIRQWIEEMKGRGSLRLPIQLYPGALRGAQGYLTKMPQGRVSTSPSSGVGVRSVRGHTNSLSEPRGRCYRQQERLSRTLTPLI